MIQKASQEEIRRHARELAPEEACGFVLPTGEVLRAHNRSGCPEDSFVMDGKSMLEAIRRGAAYLYHSHPSGSEEPSIFDKAACNRLGIPYLVYGVESDLFAIYNPRPAWEVLLEKPWSWGSDDCFGLVQGYFKVCHGIDLPDCHRPDPFPPDYNFFEAHHEEMGFRIVEDAPRRDDVISLQMMSKFETHLAIVLGDEILHHAKDRLSQREDFTKPFKDRIVHVYRHEGVRNASS